MKKRVAVTILCVLFVLWGAMFSTDYFRCASLRAPLFVVPGITADDGGSGTYIGLGYTVEIKRHMDVEFGSCIDSVEMRVFHKVIAASIA